MWLADPTTRLFFTVVKARENEARQATVEFLNSNKDDGFARAAAAQALAYSGVPEIAEAMKENEVEVAR